MRVPFSLPLPHRARHLVGVGKCLMSGRVLIHVVGTEAFLSVLSASLPLSFLFLSLLPFSLSPSLPFRRIYQVPECARASRVALVVKNLPANAGDLRDSSLFPGSVRSLGEGNSYPL